VDTRDSLRPLWTCPDCGKKLVNPNSYHSCLNWPLEKHFAGKDKARDLFEVFRAAVESTGPVTLVLNKTNIGFMTRTRFAGCQPRKDYLSAAVWLKRKPDSARARRIEQYGARDFIVRFDIRCPEDVDDEVRKLIAEARQVGDQRHEQQARRYRS
jgi:hypothetical protein